jgi:glycosyltransferase involved in cell wall biosynthesis
MIRTTQEHFPLSDVAVVIPCYRCAQTIEEVIDQIPETVGHIICVDDASDDDTPAALIRLNAAHKRVTVVTHETNQGVGGATATGYRKALELGARIIVKLDSDGQMNPAFIPALIAPIEAGEADYCKGNRFFDIDSVRAMPAVRLVGNAGLSFISKLSSGYWDLLDPTNGYTAIHAEVAALLPLNKLHKRYFFESDMLFRLSTFEARIVEQPMETRYGDETSHLSPLHALLTFPTLHLRNLTKRIGYTYFLRNFSAASLNLLGGLALGLSGFAIGVAAWLESSATGTPATAGTVMLGAMPLLIGIQLCLAFLQHDVARVPSNAIHGRLMRRKLLVTKPSNKDTDADNEQAQSHYAPPRRAAEVD